ncbi:serine/threonine-protein kinase BLUS1-like [Impatiens glandulifera]|uniref:serine/threonine-protein kinase BLUS1-like n=1 Tax=Impatiens glandulifera TaxID=253017 RepID=UPI001FB11399|nr:serine/threonine-protein kinase BLUS1-like [Impatiens glandulifera]
MEDISEEPKFPMNPKCYKIIQRIGCGKNCTIFRAFCIPMNSYVVIKSINQSGQDSESVDSQRRRQIWSILPSFSVAGSLQSLMLYSFPNGLSEDCIAVILNQILNQLSYLHVNETLHRDINAGNILLDHKGQVQLADFSYSASISELGSLSSSCWSSSLQPPLYWVAPEVTQSSDGYSMKADIWSFGILALELGHGKPPLFEIDQLSQSLIKTISERFFLGNYENYKRTPCSDKSFSESFKNLVKGCLEQDPGNRPTLEMLQKHVFFRNCKSADFLVRNMLNERFKLPTRTDEDAKEKEEVELRISGWKLKDEKLELCPILYNVPIGLRETQHVQFGGETIIEEKEAMEVDELLEKEPEEEENEENQKFGKFLEVNEQMDIISEKMDGVNETTNRDEIQFGGETIIEEKEVMEVDEQPEEEEDESEEEEELGEEEKELNQKIDWFIEVNEQIDIMIEKMGDVNETASKDEIFATLYLVKDSLEKQLSRVNSLIITQSGVLQDIISKALYLVKDRLEKWLSRVNSVIITHGGVLQDGKFNVLESATPEPESAMQTREDDDS